MRKIITFKQQTKAMLLGLLMLIPGRSHSQGPAQIKIFKISVLASGTVLLDGKQIEMKDLDVALSNTGSAGGAVLYYRELSADEPPPQAKEVISLIIKHRLPVRLCTKPDFSDYVDSEGVPHSGPPDKNVPTSFDPRMPDVLPVPDIEKVFADAKARAAGKQDPRALVLVLPDRRLAIFPVPMEPEKSAVERIQRLLPSTTPRNVVAIGYTGFANSTNVADANHAIPFLGILLGLSYIGHSVWIFEGHATAIAAGCRDADLLIVDSGMLPFLPRGWEDEAVKVMRNPNIMIYDRAIYKLRIVRKVGATDRLEFRDE